MLPRSVHARASRFQDKVHHDSCEPCAYLGQAGGLTACSRALAGPRNRAVARAAAEQGGLPARTQAEGGPDAAARGRLEARPGRDAAAAAGALAFTLSALRYLGFVVDSAAHGAALLLHTRQCATRVSIARASGMPSSAVLIEHLAARNTAYLGGGSRRRRRHRRSCCASRCATSTRTSTRTCLRRCCKSRPTTTRRARLAALAMAKLHALFT
jgi:hypothetical protein